MLDFYYYIQSIETLIPITKRKKYILPLYLYYIVNVQNKIK